MTLELNDFCDVLELKPHRISMYDCLQNAIITALEGVGENAEYLMLGTWGFRFGIDDSVHLGCGNSVCMSDLNYIKNIVLTRYEEQNVDRIFDAAKRELAQHRPLILYQDTFYNPWSLLYEKEHVDHFFVVIGIDEGGQRLLCIDNYASNDYQVLERKQMERGGLREYLTIEKKGGKDRTRGEMAMYLYEQISQKLMQEYTPFYYLKEFEKIESLKALIARIDNVESSEVMRKLARVRDMRKGFATDLLRFTEEPDLTDFGNRMLESSQFFARIIILAIKCKKAPDKAENFLNKMSDAAQKIHDIEKECICEMYQFLQTYLCVEEK